MVHHIFLIGLAFFCLIHANFADQKNEQSNSPPKPTRAAPIDPTSFVAELAFHLRGRELEGTQEEGESCGLCQKAPFCKDGLVCRGTETCLCGFNCGSGTCKANPTPAPTPPSPSPNFCFSASATVQVAGKGTVAMKDLSVGDQVLTNVETNSYEHVYAFGHFDPTAKATFVQIHTNDKQSSPLEMTEDHLLQVNGKFSRASDVNVGDTLQGGNGIPLTVTTLRRVVRNDGVYNPLTPSGTLLVENAIVSNYVSVEDKYPVFAENLPSGFISHYLIHLLLSPYRMFCLGLKMDELCQVVNEEGINRYVNWGVQATEYANTLSLWHQMTILMLAVVFILPVYLVEILFGARYAPLALTAGFIAMVYTKKRRTEQFKPKTL